MPRLILLTGLMLAAAAFVACGDDDGASPEERQEVEDIIRQLAASGPDDVDFFLDHVTDDALENFFGFSRDECRQNAEECVGEPSEIAGVDKLEISGDEAEAEVTFSFEEGGESSDQALRLILVRQDDVWKLDAFGATSQEIPEGVETVDLQLDEFSFAFDEGKARAGNFAFAVENAGEQRHEVIVVKVPEDLDVQAAIESGEEPEGVEDVGYNGPFRAGDEDTLVFEEPLEPGRYVLLCFVPDADDPEDTPHANKGMWADFNVE